MYPTYHCPECGEPGVRTEGMCSVYLDRDGSPEELGDINPDKQASAWCNECDYQGVFDDFVFYKEESNA